MGSVGNQNPWAPYYANYKDCSLGICSIYCPQFCYLILPPPPPDSDSAPFSPLIIAIIGVLATGFLLVSYYTIVTRYCKRRRNLLSNTLTDQENHEGMNHDQYFVSSGLDEELIKAITVCKYVKGDGLIEGSECAVCLSEFQENESLRLLPKCDHAFHLPCIDTWLKSHSNCPLCRTSVVLLDKPVPKSQSSSVLNVDGHEITQPDELILVVDDQESIFDERIVLCENTDDLEIKQENMLNDQEGVKKFRRSVSLDTISSECQFLISDIRESNEDLQVGSDKSMKGIGSSNGLLLKSPVPMKRSVSTERFKDKGKNPILSN